MLPRRGNMICSRLTISAILPKMHYITLHGTECCKVKTKCCNTKTGCQFRIFESAIHCNLNIINLTTASTCTTHRTLIIYKGSFASNLLGLLLFMVGCIAFLCTLRKGTQLAIKSDFLLRQAFGRNATVQHEEQVSPQETYRASLFMFNQK